MSNVPADIAPESSNRYPFQAIERKWQARWQDADLYRTSEGADKPKYYVLDMFPYPSGSGLHVGHGKNYIPGDVYARFLSQRGYNVLHPMGWDAFGQPAEQDAIKRGVNPRQVVPQLAQEYKRQLSLLGLGYDWNREINSTDPSYYRWNQWAFLLLYKRGLAFRKFAPVNWCVNESTVLANEEVSDGKCWRCDGPVVKRDLPQWLFKITAYGDKLLDGLDTIDWPEGVKTQQRDWIGRSEGAEVDFAVVSSQWSVVGEEGTNENAPAAAPVFATDHQPVTTDHSITVYTTRPDTLWGATFLVLSPEHPLVEQITTKEQQDAVGAYREEAQRTSDMDRQAEGRPKTGVFTGAYGINPVNGKLVPIWIADYVLMGYGTGAIMAVPAHDQRDFEFARKFNLPVSLVYKTDDAQTGDSLTEAFASGGTFAGEYNTPFIGLPNDKTTVKTVIGWLEEHGMGRGRVNFRLRDWLVSRQRYWGTPIPIIHCPACGEVPVPEDQLPVVLPDVENYKPGADGASPLASIASFVNVKCPTCGEDARRETDTMAGSVDSSWYFLRFTSPHDEREAWDRAASDYWMPVDKYLGGREHAVGHLLYARFFTKVFHDAGLISANEPFQSLRNQGMLLSQTPVQTATGHAIKPDDRDRFSEDEIEYQWLKMSKSKGNSVTPDEIAERYGADALRVYILFEAPFEDTIQWSEERINGSFRFLSRVYDVLSEIAPAYSPDWAAKLGEVQSADEKALRRQTHQTIALLTENVADFRFNTAVSALMILTTALRKFTSINGAQSPAAHEAAHTLTLLLAPFAPHLSDELYEMLGYAGFTLRQTWPAFDAGAAANEEITLVVQVNGKVRDKITLAADADQAASEAAALGSEKVREALAGKPPRKVIYVPGKLVNIVA